MNAFSKKIEMRGYAAALHFMHYNFVRIHKTLKVTPAMAAGVTGKLWEIADVVALLPDEEYRSGDETDHARGVAACAWCFAVAVRQGGGKPTRIRRRGGIGCAGVLCGRRAPQLKPDHYP